MVPIEITFLKLCFHLDVEKISLQWRNSYGLRVCKPAGTRAEGAPEGCPLSLGAH